MKNKKPLVSIIIPTHNSSEFVEECLLSIKNQTYKNIEIIVIDNNSTDDTKNIASKYTSKLFNKGPERSSQRNYGIKVASGQYVAIIDSDMILSEKVIEKCVNKITDSKVNIKQLIIPEISIGKGFWAEVKAFERFMYINDPDIEAARFFNKAVIIKLGGYDEKIKGGGEEYDLPERMLKFGYKQSRINDKIIHQEGNLSLIDTIKTKYYYGKTAKFYFSKQPKNAIKKINIIRPAFIRNWIQFIKHPILGLGLIIMKLSEFSAGGIGMIISIIKSESNYDKSNNI